jgi:hypothetical protein
MRYLYWFGIGLTIAVGFSILATNEPFGTAKYIPDLFFPELSL